MKLYSGLGIEFRVAPNEQFIAAEPAGVELALLDGQGQLLRGFDLAQLSDHQPDEFYADIGLTKWSEDSRVFWGELVWAGHCCSTGLRPLPGNRNALTCLICRFIGKMI